MKPPVDSGRRCLLGALPALSLAGWGRQVRAHGQMGPVTPPVLAPMLPLTLHDNRQARLPELLRGRLSAVQLMFTGCSATCPIQGALFASLQERLGQTLPQAQLLSVSIDPLNDDAKALSSWRARFEARSQWLAAAPALRQADVLLDFLGARRPGPERHNAQVFLFDAQARLVFRFAEFASARDIVPVMRQAAG